MNKYENATVKFIFTFSRMDSQATLTLITGPMFAGKTETLIAKIQAAQAAGYSTSVFKPAKDTRYATDAIVTHAKNSIGAIAIQQAKDLYEHLGTAQVVGIDEAQFFDATLPAVCKDLQQKGLIVYIGGLELDYRAEPFGIMPQLLEMATEVIRLTANCAVCGKAAQYTYRKTKDKATFLLGEQEIYEPRCKECFKK